MPELKTLTRLRTRQVLATRISRGVPALVETPCDVVINEHAPGMLAVGFAGVIAFALSFTL